MANKSYTEKFLTFLADGKANEARKITEDVEAEIKSLKCKLTQSQKDILKNVGVIILQLRKDQDRSAKTIAASTEIRFAEHHLGEVFQVNIITKGDGYNVSNDANRGNTVQGAMYEDGRDGIYTIPGKENQHYATPPGHRQQNGLSEEEINMLKASKIAGESMRRNNPDIADLSDMNRPTRVAERFSELYENEWTEAFEMLGRKQMRERDIAGLLLEIVQEAYKFCMEEAECQIEKIHSAFLDILEFGKPCDTSRGWPADTNFILQHRKDNAAVAVKRLIKEFFKKLCCIYVGQLGGTAPPDNGVVARYGNKAVELSWLMCVQDPPVYMCPTDRDFDENLYRAYTKSGRTPDFFVWPALKLHREGGILLKGVVQYK